MTDKCEYCGLAKHPAICPTVKAIEYFPSGKVKRVEFKCAPDYAYPTASGHPLPAPPAPPKWPITSVPTLASLPLCGCMPGTACMNAACPYRTKVTFGNTVGCNGLT
jgi:hypothetical protein